MAAIDDTEKALALLRKQYPTASTFIELSGPKIEMYGHLALHHRDLEFAKDCFSAFLKIPRTDDSEFIREVFWKSAVITFVKCFGQNDSRSTLKWDAIYIDPKDQEEYRFFITLRNKHIAHDSNPFSDFRAVAAINPEGMVDSVAAIDCARFISAVHNQSEKVEALARLIDLAIKHVAARARAVNREIKAECKRMSRDQLLSYPAVRSPQIKWTDVDKPRPSWKKRR